MWRWRKEIAQCQSNFRHPWSEAEATKKRIFLMEIAIGFWWTPSMEQRNRDVLCPYVLVAETERNDVYLKEQLQIVKYVQCLTKRFKSMVF